MRVAFVSKPLGPPWNDGSKNLVRDISTHLGEGIAPLVYGPNEIDLGGEGSAGSVFVRRPRGAQAVPYPLRLLWTITEVSADLFHFVFAPHPRAAQAFRAWRAARRAMRKGARSVQTVPSRPRDYREELFFGDRLIVLSEWQRKKLLACGVRADRIELVPPCVPTPLPPSAKDLALVNDRIGAHGAPVVLYPGDLEFSSGAWTVARAVHDLAQSGALVVFACRPKTPRARGIEAGIRAYLQSEGLADRVRFLGEVPSMPALLAKTTVVLFPVDDLYGKIDLPLVLLEALGTGVPLVLARGGSLEEISVAMFVDAADSKGLAERALELLSDARARRELGDAGKVLARTRFSAESVGARHADIYRRMLRL